MLRSHLRRLHLLSCVSVALVVATSSLATRAGESELTSEVRGINVDRPVVYRDRVATHYQLPDGTLRAVLTTRPQNYRDVEGNWHAIDPTIAEAHRLSRYAFENVTNGLTMRFPRTLSDGVRVAGQSLPAIVMVPRAFVALVDGVPLMALEPSRTEPMQIDAQRVVYPGLFPLVDDEYAATNDRLKHTLVLHHGALKDMQAADQIGAAFELQLPVGLTLRVPAGADALAGFEARTVELIGVNGATIYELGPVFADDAAAQHCAGTLHARLEGDRLVTTMLVPTAWLLDSARKWPVRIDPTITLQPDAAAGKDALLHAGGSGTSNYGSYESLTFNSSGECNGIIQFDMASVPPTAIMTAVQMELYHRSNSVTGNIIELREATGTWIESTVSWANAPAASTTVSSTLTYPSGTLAWRIFTNLNAVTQTWVNGSAPNNGLRLVNSTNPIFSAYHNSSDYVYPVQWPKYVIDYTMPAPIATGVAPDPVNWLQTLTITGTSFDFVSDVTIGGVTQAIMSNTSTQIQVTVADTTPTGSQTVVVTTPTGSDSTQTVTVNTTAPVVTGVAPDPVDWLATLTLTGTGLTATPTVTIGGIAQAVTSAVTGQVEVTVNSATPLGSQPIIVTTAGGSDSTQTVTINPAAPVISGLTPDPVQWLQTLTISGGALDGASVWVAGVPATVTANTATQIDITVPDTVIAGVQAVLVVTTHGSDATTVTLNGIAPTVTAVAPNPVVRNGTLTIDGTYLFGATVDIGGVSAAVQSNTSTQIVALVDVTTPTGVQTVTVTNPHGSDAAQSVQVTAAPINVGGGGGGGGCAVHDGEHATPWPLVGMLLALTILALARRRVS